MVELNLSNTDCLYSTLYYTEQMGIAGYFPKNVGRVFQDYYIQILLCNQGKYGYYFLYL
jgi:hypothetical protein